MGNERWSDGWGAATAELGCYRAWLWRHYTEHDEGRASGALEALSSVGYGHEKLLRSAEVLSW